MGVRVDNGRGHLQYPVRCDSNLGSLARAVETSRLQQDGGGVLFHLHSRFRIGPIIARDQGQAVAELKRPAMAGSHNNAGAMLARRIGFPH